MTLTVCTRWRQHESRGPYPFFVDVGVVVAGDTLYLGSNEGLLTLDTEAGAFLDVHEFADDNEFWPPVVADGPLARVVRRPGAGRPRPRRDATDRTS